MFSIEHIIQSGGILLIGAIVFAESGLLVGFFLPGDTLLFGAGLFASQGKISLPLVIAVIIGAAIAGDNVGFTIGQKAGPRIFRKKDGLLFRQEYLEKARVFYEKHGGKVVLFARFVPIVRTFAPVVTGASDMSRKKFVGYDIIGATIWGAGVTLLGYWFGSKIPGLSKYFEFVILGVVFVSLGGSVLHILKDPKTRKLLISRIRGSHKEKSDQS